MKTLILAVRNFVRDSAARAVLGVAVSMVALGTVFFRFVEDLDWIDSLYFCVITLTTVGYGDISPETTAGKLFTIVYVITGIGVFVALVSATAQHFIEARAENRNAASGPINP